MSETKTVEILVNYHGESDKVFASRFEMTEDSLIAMTRHLSSIRLSEVEMMAVLPMKNMHDACRNVCKNMP